MDWFGLEIEPEILKHHYSGAGTALYLNYTICWPASSGVYCVTTSAQQECVWKNSQGVNEYVKRASLSKLLKCC